MFLKISEYSKKNICARVSFFNKVAGFRAVTLKKEILAQVCSCEFCEIFINTFFIQYFWLLLLNIETLDEENNANDVFRKASHILRYINDASRIQEVVTLCEMRFNRETA